MSTMNKDRIKGRLEQAKGKIKEVAGKATGDAKLRMKAKRRSLAEKSGILSVA
jgi:uncharacterized protein YjbJ (UPF0337 family)